MKTTFKPLRVVRLHCILRAVLLQDLRFPTSQCHRVTQRVPHVPRGAGMSNVLSRDVLEDHERITPRLPF